MAELELFYHVYIEQCYPHNMYVCFVTDMLEDHWEIYLLDQEKYGLMT